MFANPSFSPEESNKGSGWLATSHYSAGWDGPGVREDDMGACRVGPNPSSQKGFCQ